ncbi:4Fe-4S ferredoxin [Clostridia bacterium]|nr:4Fe-4S ferredoxin [Clostridia bacterium]
MPSKLLFAPVAYSRYEKEQTLPCKFERMLEQSKLGERLKDKTVAIKMHVGDGVSYSTIPPVFVRTLVDYVKKNGGECFITDHSVNDRHPERRGYSEANLGCPVLEGCAFTGKYVYTKEVDYRSLKHVDIAGLIHDADFLIDFTHVKGHGACAYGGACKNIAMGCVTHRTRQELHGLEGGLVWDEDKCIHCEQCVKACNHDANEFNKDGKYEVFFHHCTLCQHCMKVCPTGAITLDNHGYTDFQMGMAIATKTVLEQFLPDNVYFINVLLQITALCDCWGLTTPGLVPDIGILAGSDMVAIEQASLDLIKIEDLVKVGVPQGYELTGHGHLFEQLHGKSPFTQLDALESVGLGHKEYELITIS